MTTPVLPPSLGALLDRLDTSESLDLEFKAAQGGLPRSIWPTISAFANTNGGWIVLGVEERGERLSVVGVADASALLAAFYDALHNPSKMSYPVCRVNDAFVETLDGKQLLILRVPAAPRAMCPVYINGNPYGGTYVRRHTGDYLSSKREVDRMMREASDVAADATILPYFGLDDLDSEALARYRQYYRTRNPSSPWNGYDDQRFLQAIGGYDRNPETGTQGITVAGLLLLGKLEAIRSWRKRHLIDYRLSLDETDPSTRWDDRIVWESNLFGAFETIYPRLIDGLPVPFRLQGTFRVAESPAHEALREALVNLLVHADYAETEASLIKRTPEGYFFRNPGNSRISEIDLLIGDRSDPRNPAIVRMFRLVGWAEEAGTGIAKIRRAWRELGFRLSPIDVGSERYEFTLSLRYAHLFSEEQRHWLSALGEHWTEAEQLALVLAKENGDVDNATLSSLTGQHPADITKVLGGLRDHGLLQKTGFGRGARYQLGSLAMGGPFLAALAAAEPQRAGEPTIEPTPAVEVSRNLNTVADTARSSPDNPSSLSNSPESSGDSGLTLGGFSESSGDSGLDSGISAASSGSSALGSRTSAHILEAIAKPAREQPYLGARIVEDIIVNLCKYTPLSVDELATLLGRSADHTRKTVHTLIGVGRLAFLYPERRSHPAQKYLTIEVGEKQDDRT